MVRSPRSAAASTAKPPTPSTAPSDPAPATLVQPLAGARIVVAVGGGIAAYKAAELVRLLDKAGAEVQVAMTRRAQAFITPLTFTALTRKPVATELVDPGEEHAIGHIQLADRADLIIVAPATANLMARLASGAADDVVTAVCLATTKPVLLAPSMNVNMWQHPLTQANLRRLTEVAGYHVVGPGDGFLACRWVGPGRLAEPADIVEAAAQLLTPQDWAGKHVVIDAGPTYEPIDPVRFIGNRSSGKMGYALAAAARRRGARVTLISGPTALAAPVGVTLVAVETAAQMRAAVLAAVDDADLAILAAAVADFRPAEVAPGKLKRSALGARPQLALVANPDILAEVGARARRPILVGFAAETGDALAEARRKLVSKRCDLIVGNDVSAPGLGFASDRNQVVLVSADRADPVAAAGKDVIAHAILDHVRTHLLGRPRARRAQAAPARVNTPGPTRRRR
ncbi:MAG: bifunctional phosphopantothenoylcysteine decarboxylase/phosphopantothenate--cysteine ligase CoaBC [Kofleriaceae bacterium]|nr:bifunctional phosphopantothenoylcysteine decarboxylase/phosphopantothenate--cysteine ligase CoaBC [Kofleriaceae bacterium]